MRKPVWKLAFALPNLVLAEPIEAPHVALCPFDDGRVKELVETSSGTRLLLEGFRDMSGRSVNPVALLLDINAPKSVRAEEAIAAFRNCVAMSIILPGWAGVTRDASPWNPLWSDFFDFHPASVNSNEDIYIDTAAYRLMGGTKRFLSTVYPYISLPGNGKWSIDRPILHWLLSLWAAVFTNPRTKSSGHKHLFRSLEVAYLAAAVPVKHNASIAEWGVHVSLWVSALEILAHPQRGKVQKTGVLDLLMSYGWGERALDSRWYPIKITDRLKRRYNLVVHVCNRLYGARNSFLHGNPVDADTLMPFGRGIPTLVQLAPVVYRTALAAYLKPLVPQPTTSAVGASDVHEALFRWYWIQHEYEDCLLRAVKKSKDHPVSFVRPTKA